MNKEKTIREMINEYQNEILKGELQPQRARVILIELSSLIGNLNDKIRVADMEFNKVLMACYESEEKANRAKIKAEISPEFEAKRIARDTKDLTIELIRSLKYFMKSFEEEYRAGRNV